MSVGLFGDECLRSCICRVDNGEGQMRIGLITWWKTLNYGAMLQAIATYAFLKSLGHDVECVDFRQPADRYPEMLRWRRWYRGKQGLLKLFLEYKAFDALGRIRKSRACVESCLKLGRLCKSYDDIVAEHYDLIVVGSDQLWNPKFLEEEGKDYLFTNMPASVKRISLATSIATETLPDNFKERFYDGLSKFLSLSVREPSLIPLLEEMSGKKVFWSVDPTLLFSGSDWVRLLKLKVCDVNKKSPIVGYFLSGFENYLDSLIAVAKHEKRKLHLYVDLHSLRYFPGLSARGILSYLHMRAKLMFSRHIKICMSASPADFVQDVANSYAVVADSFHALMFATVFRKNVKVHVPDSRKCMGSRITCFLDRTGIRNVVVDQVRPDCLERGLRTDYPTEGLDNWIGETKGWIRRAIEGTK